MYSSSFSDSIIDALLTHASPDFEMLLASTIRRVVSHWFLLMIAVSLNLGLHVHLQQRTARKPSGAMLLDSSELDSNRRRRGILFLLFILLIMSDGGYGN